MKITNVDIGYYGKNNRFALILNLSEIDISLRPVTFITSLVISPVVNEQFCHKTFSEILEKLISKADVKSYSKLIGMEIDCYLGEESQIQSIGIGKEGYGYAKLQIESINGVVK